MKHRLFIFSVFVALAVSNCYGQRVTKRYFAVHPFHAFYFGTTGEFIETTGYRSFFGIVSKGTYREKKKNFILTSDSSIMFSDSLTINSEISSSYQPVDSLIINVTSPYEKLLYEVSAPNVGFGLDALDVPILDIHRIYCYDIQIVCSEDSISQSFERDFNQSHHQVCEARVAVFKQQEVSIKEIRMKIYWNPDSGDTILNRRYPFANTRVKVDVPHDNVYMINIPQFDYFFLTYKRYKNKRIRKSGKNAIVFEKRKFILREDNY